MSIAVQGFLGASDWSATTRSRHYSNAGFCSLRVILPTFYPAGSNPITDTNFATNYNFQVGIEYPYTNADHRHFAAHSGHVQWLDIDFIHHDRRPVRLYRSDVVNLPTCVPAGAFFGLWTTIEAASGSGTNVIPYDYNSSNYLQKYIGYDASTTSLIAASTALNASSIPAISTSQNGLLGIFHSRYAPHQQHQHRAYGGRYRRFDCIRRR